MNKRQLADRFSRDVDYLLQQNGLSEPTPTVPEYEDMLNLARKLATTDFSQRSRIRHSLRRRLLNRIDQTPASTVEIPGPLGLLKQLLSPGRARLEAPVRLWKNRFVLASLAGLIVIVSFMALISRPELQVRNKLVDMLAQVMAYLPVNSEPAPHILALRWQFRGGDGISSAPTAANGLIYAGSNDGYLYALDAQTGEVVWRFGTAGIVSLRPTVAWGLVYAASDDGYLYALHGQTGLEKWQFKTDGRFSLEPTIAAGMVLVGADNGSLYALDAGNGQEKWQFKAGNAILPQATVAGKTFYLGSQDHHLYALELETGQEKWRFNVGDWIATAPIEVAGLIYVGSYDENFYVIDAETGQERQRADLGNKVRTSATLAAGTLYFGSYDSYLHAVDGATGQEIWRFKMAKQTLSAPIVVGGVVFIGSGDGYLYEVNAQTGEEIARYGVDSQIYTAPAVVENTIYFVSGKGELYAVQRMPLASTEEHPEETEVSISTEAEPAGFQITPGAWYVTSQDEMIRFRGRIMDGAGQPVNGVSIQADNGSLSILSEPSGPNRWHPQARDGEWEIVISKAERGAGWWWLTAVRYECSAAAPNFNPQCQEFTRLSESVKVEIVYPDETLINADWTCQWDCQNLSKK